MNLHAAVIQYAPTTDKTANLELITQLVGKAADQGAELAVLPEYATFSKPGVDESFVASAEDLDGPMVTALCKLSVERDIALIAGVSEPDGRGRIFNTLIGIQGGEIQATYRKLHLYDAFGQQESQWVVPGAIQDPQILEVNGYKIGLQTCYDLRFPEVSRVLVDAGADVLALPAAWVPGPLKENHWTTLLRARAIENTVYVVAADQSAPTGVGHSCIIDPMGNMIAMIGDDVGIARAELTEERITSTRTTNPALAGRRFRVSPKE
ncbi:carbon-nitrogen hydrolase family protein [Enteractinococcus coprophilus]|uniref:Putative amidohydrolase n=1 Tax=Enteractinococcus coprophilus TaxID=1027633 RepID=A0A543AN18_9MICC|nr:carbon-nitrogen hydrolase family protein [Enteractinococcus coprophilus]TQL73945.1 putative amidohydrolase [Enteractinococcus coprophilus]